MELLVSAELLVLFQHVLQANAVQGVVVHSQVYGDLSEEGNREPGSENRVGCSDVRQTLQRLGVREEIEVYRGQYSQHRRLLL